MNINIHRGRLGALSPANDDAALVIVDARPRPYARGQGSEPGIRVLALHTERCPITGNRIEAYREVVWCGSRWEPNSRNKIGGLGAFADVPPSEAEIEQAIGRARAALERGDRV